MKKPSAWLVLAGLTNIGVYTSFVWNPNLIQDMISVIKRNRGMQPVAWVTLNNYFVWRV